MPIALGTRPRPVTLLPTQNAVYREVVRRELLRLGVSKPVVNITSIARADLDGNGTQEVVIDASHFSERGGWSYQPPGRAVPGDYSVELLRWVEKGQAHTTVLAESHFVPGKKWPNDWQVPYLYNLAGIADLNGDGRMELVNVETYYEGQSGAVLEWTPAGGAKVRLSEGCGA